ncbi:MAG: glycoside hydrolase family 2 TIM barrel-domain containing protein [Ignavibacteria bacterium]
MNSENLSSVKEFDRELYVKTKLLKINSNEVIAESIPVKLAIDDYQSVNLTNQFLAKNVNLWSPENPELYTIKTVIQNSSGTTIDERTCEIGFVNIKIRNENISLNGKNISLNGINYNEDSPRFGSTLDYSEVEFDLKKIKEFGFNCIRVEGKPAHPYIINICNRIGLFILQEIPFNEVPERVLKDNNYTQFAIDYLESIIKRDKNSPAVIAWGIGNNFDVTCISASNYVKNIKEATSKLDSRQLYYTTRNLKNDICSEFIDLKGINFSTNSYDKLQKYVDEIKASNKQNSSVFVSSYGMCINNDNRNGFGDRQSVEAQAKFLSESYKIVSNSFFANFISSYSDWNAESPLNLQLNSNPYLKTDGIFDFYREQKSSAMILKRLINGQGYQKIPEGSGEIMNKDNYFVFIITGLISIIFFFFLLGKLRYFKSNIIKSIISPKNFIYFVKEQMLIAAYRNIILNFLIALSLGLFFASVIYLFRENIYLDMLLSSVFTNPEAKMNIAYVINSPINLLLLFSVAIYLKIILITSFAFVLNFFYIKKSNLRTIYTITVWSFIPFLIFLLIGTVIYKLSGEGSSFITVTLVLFILIYLYCYIKLFHGYKIIFEISTLKTVIYGLLIFIFVHMVTFAYFYYIKSTLSIFDLILSYNH